MKHKIGYNRLGRRASQRKALLRSMTTSLLRYERIKTTKAKAREVRRVAEKLITRAKSDSVHNRRIVARRIGDKKVLAKLFTDIAPRYELLARKPHLSSLRRNGVTEAISPERGTLGARLLRRRAPRNDDSLKLMPMGTPL